MEYVDKAYILNKTKSFLQHYIGARDLKFKEDIFSSGWLANSLFAMQLVLFLEEEFQVKVENQDLVLENFSTLNDITEFVMGKIKFLRITKKTG